MDGGFKGLSLFLSLMLDLYVGNALILLTDLWILVCMIPEYKFRFICDVGISVNVYSHS